MIDGHPYLVDYNRAEGILVIDRVNDDLQGTEEKYRGRADPGMTAVEPMYVHGENEMLWIFLYGAPPMHDGATARLRACSERTWDGGNTWSGAWDSGWRFTKPFYLNGGSYLFSYYPPPFGKATVTIGKMLGLGGGFGEVWRGEWASNNWTAIEPFYSGGHAYLVSYKMGDGTVAIDRINDDLHGTDELWRGEWNVIWSLVKPFYVDTAPYVLVYSNNTTGHGAWTIYRVNEDCRGFTKVSEGDKWLSPYFPFPAWFTLEPFYIKEQVYFVGCSYIDSLIPDPFDPTVEFAELGPDLQTVSTKWYGKWRKGWTNIKPFYAPATPFPPIIPG